MPPEHTVQSLQRASCWGRPHPALSVGDARHEINRCGTPPLAALRNDISVWVRAVRTGSKRQAFLPSTYAFTALFNLLGTLGESAWLVICVLRFLIWNENFSFQFLVSSLSHTHTPSRIGAVVLKGILVRETVVGGEDSHPTERTQSPGVRRGQRRPA